MSQGYIGQIVELIAKDLTDEQKVLVRKFFNTEIEALQTLLGKSKRVLGSSEDSFTETDKLEVEELEKRVAALEKNAAATEADRKFWKDLLAQKRIQNKREVKTKLSIKLYRMYMEKFLKEQRQNGKAYTHIIKTL